MDSIISVSGLLLRKMANKGNLQNQLCHRGVMENSVFVKDEKDS
jgi:hypothetical protein